MIERSILIVLSVALVASLAGFFLYVPVMTNLTVTVVLGGLFAMFWLGVRVGRRPQGAVIANTSDESRQLSLS